jgi:hypothetical protein
MRAVAILDPLAPMCWDGLILWPDAIGTALAAMQDPAAPGSAIRNGANQAGANQTGANQTVPEQTVAEQASRIASLITVEAHVIWAGSRPDRSDTRLLRLDARQMHALMMLPGPAGGLSRLAYQLNPLLPCAGPGLDGQWVARLADLTPALEAAARRDRAPAPPIGAAVAAFIAARGDRALETVVTRLTDAASIAEPLTQLRLLAQLQARTHSGRLPALGAWIAERLEGLLAVWHSRPRRTELRPKLHELAVSGQLVALLALLDDAQARRNDEYEVQQAARDLARIDTALVILASGGPARADQARRLGQEVAAGIGLSVLALLLVIAALG